MSQNVRSPATLRYFELSMLMLTCQTARCHKVHYLSATLHHYSNKANTSFHGAGHHFGKGSDSRQGFLMDEEVEG